MAAACTLQLPASPPRRGSHLHTPVCPPCVVQEEEAPAPAKKPAFAFGGFGTRKISKPEPAAVEEVRLECGQRDQRCMDRVAMHSCTSTAASCTAAASLQNACAGMYLACVDLVSRRCNCLQEEEEEAPAPKKAFAFGTSGSRRPAAAVAVAEPEARPAAPQRVVRGRAPVAAPAEEKPARAAPARQAAAEPAAAAAAPKKSGGFLGFLGISNETVYADEP